MHMGNELLSLPVAGVTLAAAGIAVLVVGIVARRRLDTEKTPLMGVFGAFVFAAQMINFTLPGMPGTSGHLGGGVLLAIVLGPAAGIITMAAILIVQCLMFQDGGLLALGCNIINMGVVPCLGGWALYRLLLGTPQRVRAARQHLAAWAACLAAVTAGAALVPVEAAVSGVLKIPVAQFLGVMVGVHLFIGFFEGLITFAVIAYLRRARPTVLGLDRSDGSGDRLGRKALAGSMLVTSLLLAGVVSWFASSFEDGLEWSLGRNYGQEAGALRQPDPTILRAQEWQEQWAPLPEYNRRGAEPTEAWPAVNGWGSLAGVVGTTVTLAIVYVVSVLLRRRARRSAAVGRS